MHRSTTKLSVIIATSNRLGQMKECIESIRKNTSHRYEILVIDQSTDTKTRDWISTLRGYPVRYFHNTRHNKCMALNKGIRNMTGDIAIFTDDDCIVSRTWLAMIAQAFDRHPDIAGVFGRTMPYQAKRHKLEICPCTTMRKTQRYITTPCRHWETIGFGNNMAFRREIFDKIGSFKPWLGPGSIGSNAEDAEFALRVLMKGYKLLYNPKMIVYHNKWLTPEKMKTQQLSYSCGEMACYGYFYFQGHLFAKPVIINNVRDSYYKARNILKNVLLLRWNITLRNAVSCAFLEMVSRARGLIVGFIYALIDPAD